MAKKKAPSSEAKKASNPPTSGLKSTTIPLLSTSTIDESHDFPRGAAPQMTRSVDRVSTDQLETTNETLFNENPMIIEGEMEKDTKKKRRNEDDRDDNDAPQKRSRLPGLSGPTIRVVPLRHQRIPAGMVMLGTVKEIRDLEITIALPNNVIGKVPITEISEVVSKAVEDAAEAEENDQELDIPDLKAMFRVGQLVRCVTTQPYVKNDETRKKSICLELSIKPSRINTHLSSTDIVSGLVIQVEVKSREDHGYIIDFGIEGMSGFLNQKNADSYIELKNNNQPFLPGQVIDCYILSVSSGRTAQVTLDPQTVAKAILGSKQAVSLNSVMAGAIVKAVVSQISHRGIGVSFLDLFEGVIDYNHSLQVPGEILASGDEQDRKKSLLLENQFSIGDKVTAKIIYVIPIDESSPFEQNSNRFVLTLRKNLIEGTDLSAPIPIGTTLSDARVESVEPEVGLIVSLPETEKTRTLGFVNIKKVSDSPITKLDRDGHYGVGSTHQCRIINYDPIDGILYGCMQESVLSEVYVDFDTLYAGKIISDARVLSVNTENNTIVVKMSESSHIRAFIPSTHISDLPSVSKLEKRYKMGDKVKIRLVRVIPEERRVIATMKKTLLQPDHIAVTSVGQALQLLKQAQMENKELWIDGVLNNITIHGCYVSFFNNISGLIHMQEFDDEVKENPEAFFKRGQIIKCRIVGGEKSKTRLRLSLKSPATVSLLRSDVNCEPIKPGTVISEVKVEQISEEKRYIIVSHPHPLHPSTTTQTIVFERNLSDFPSRNQKLFNTLEVGKKLQNMMILQIGSKKNDMSHGTFRFGMVQSRFNDLESRIKFPHTREEISAGDVVMGQVIRVDDASGIRIIFGNNIMGTVFRSHVTDRFVHSLSGEINLDQTVIAVVYMVDTERGFINLSLKESDIVQALGEPSYNKIQEWFARSLLESSSTFGNFDFTANIGEKVEVAVTRKIGNAGVVGKIGDSQNCFITKEHFGKKLSLNEGDIVQGVVFDADPWGSVVDVSLKPELFDMMTVQLPEGKIDCYVELVKEDYLIVNGKGSLIYVPTKTYFNSSKPFERFRCGQKVVVFTLATSTNSLNIGYLTSVLFSKKNKKDRELRLVKNAIDSSIKSIDDFKLGMKIKCSVKGIKRLQMNITVCQGDSTAEPPIPPVFGRVLFSECVESIEEIPESRRNDNIFRGLGYKTNDIIEARVIGLHDAKTHRWLPFSHVNGTRTVLELSVKKAALENDDYRMSRLTLNDLKVGDIRLACIEKVTDKVVSALWLRICDDVRGFASMFEISNDIEDVKNLDKKFTVGMPVMAQVVDIDEENQRCQFSLKSAGKNDGSLAAIKSWHDVQVGSILVGRVIATESTFVNIQLSAFNDGVYGRAEIVDLSDEYQDNCPSNFAKGQLVSCRVVNVDTEHNRIDLSLRLSENEVVSVDDLTENMILQGYVVSVNDKGCFVQLGRKIVGRVKIAELSDDFIKDWKNLYKVGQVVKAKVLGIDKENSRAELSLKMSAVDPVEYAKIAGKDKYTYASLEEGAIVTGTVSRVEKYGVLIEIDNSQCTGKNTNKMRGLCKREDLADNVITDIALLYSIGDRVKAKVLKIDRQKWRINLGLKSSYLEDDSDSDAESDSDVEMHDAEVEGEDNNSDGNIVIEEPSSEDEIEEQENDSCDEDSGSTENTQLQSKISTEEVLDSATGFNWDDGWKDDVSVQSIDFSELEASDNEAQQGSAEVNKTKKMSKRAKARAKREAEQRISKKEMELANDEIVMPETSDEFDRLVLASPNSSFLWIQYIAFYVNLIELDKARQVAERALKTISFREEKEKLNVWLAYLNLENKYGTPESLDGVFQRAINYNEPKHVFLSMAKIFEKSDKLADAEDIYRKTIKKFKTSCKVWVQYGIFWFSRGKMEEARQALQRSLQSLPKRKHVKVTSKFAQLEYKFGDAERGRTIFEKILNNHSKRVDLWSVYLDKEIQNGDQEYIRRLFERCISMKLSSKKMKFFFKKYLEYEKSYGDENSVEHVIEAAQNYVSAQQ